MKKIRKYNLDNNMLPKEGWIYWETKNGIKCSDPNGKIYDKPCSWMLVGNNVSMGNRTSTISPGIRVLNYHCQTREGDKFFVKANSQCVLQYVKWHKGQELLEISSVSYDTRRHIDGRKRQWSFVGDRLFLDVKTKIFYDGLGRTVVDSSYATDDCIPIHYLKIGKNTFWSIRQFVNSIFKVFTEKNKHQIITAIGDRYCVGTGSFFPIVNSYSFSRWFLTKKPQIKKNKNQKIINQLTKKDIGVFSKEKFFAALQRGRGMQNSNNYNDWRVASVGIWLQNISDDLGVIRMSMNNVRLEEVYRIYFYKGDMYACVYVDGHWVSCSAIAPHDWYSLYFIYDIQNINQLKYQIKSIDHIFEYSKYNLGNCYNDNVLTMLKQLITVCKQPVIEQLINIGCDKLAKSILQSYNSNETIKNLFGPINKKEKSIRKIINLTIEQIKYINNCMPNNYQTTPINDMNHFCHVKSLDETTFKTIYDFECNFYRQAYRYIYSFNKNYGTETNVQNVLHFAHLTALNADFPQIYKDTRRSYETLDTNMRPDNVDWVKEDNYYYINLHDQLVRAYQEQRRQWERRWRMTEEERNKDIEKTMVKIDQTRKEYEYEDDKYLIRLPKMLKELTEEGNSQRICIGGYRESHGLGKTNIFFLRDKNNPEKPFYAIEMNNNKQIIQIHGFCNQWLGNNPEAIPTVLRWIKKMGIDCRRDILLCTARGYASNGTYVDMPAV